MVEAVEEARVEASSRCSSPQTQQLLAEDSSKTVRRMTMVDGAVCDLGHTQGRSGDGAGCSKCRAQISGGDGVFLQEHRAAMSVRKRLEARRRIERLLDEDRRRVAPPPLTSYWLATIGSFSELPCSSRKN